MPPVPQATKAARSEATRVFHAAWHPLRSEGFHGASLMRSNRPRATLPASTITSPVGPVATASSEPFGPNAVMPDTDPGSTRVASRVGLSGAA